MSTQLAPQEALEYLVERAKALGAGAAECSLSVSESLSVDVRLGAFEGVERSEGRSIALRALIGKQQAGATANDFSRDSLDNLAERVVAMAKFAPEDAFCGLLSPEERVQNPRKLDSHDIVRLSAEQLEGIARRAEEAALAVKGVTNSAGSGASWSAGKVMMLTSDGFSGGAESTSYGVGVSPIAERDGLKERDYDGRSKRFYEDLPPPESIGASAGNRAAARLGSRKIPSRRAPVIFENRIAARIIGPALSAISGGAVARGVSFLKDKLGKQVFGSNIVIEEDPFLPRGLASRPFDGEGAEGQKRRLFDQGVLTTWLLNASAARQLGMKSTGHATLGHGGPPGISTSNVTLSPGDKSLEQLMRDAGEGLLVVEMFSPALNSNTGDWSVGVAGFWFENGERAFPVSEVTVASNLLEIYARMIPGSDLERRGSTDAPSIFVDDLAIAGL